MISKSMVKVKLLKESKKKEIKKGRKEERKKERKKERKTGMISPFGR